MKTLENLKLEIRRLPKSERKNAIGLFLKDYAFRRGSWLDFIGELQSEIADDEEINMVDFYDDIASYMDKNFPNHSDNIQKLKKHLPNHWHRF